MSDEALTPLGELLEQARTKVLRISAREAARRAGISSTRWKQVVTGVAVRAGVPTQVRSRERTLVAMALAVGVEPGEALQAAGVDASEQSVEAMVAEARQPAAAPVVRPGARKLVDEIERIKGMRSISPKDRIRMINAIVDLYEEQTASIEG